MPATDDPNHPAANDPRKPLRGLAVANRLRPMRAEMKRQVATGKVNPYALIEGNVGEWEEIVATTRLRYVLEAIPGIGPVTTGEILAELGVRPDGDTRFSHLSWEGRKRCADLVRMALGVEVPPTL